MLENKAKCSVHPDLENRMCDETAQVYGHYKCLPYWGFPQLCYADFNGNKIFAFVI